MAYREPHAGHEWVHERLQDWGSWVVAKLDGLGWNTKFGDRDSVGVYQKRNDMHADPVLMEIIHHLRFGTVREIETHSAYKEMPLAYRNALVIRYVQAPKGSLEKIADELGVDKNFVTCLLRLIYEEMELRLAERRHVRIAQPHTA